jgi:hypothetical protein
MSAGLRGRAARAFKLQAYPKFAATVDDQGVPNVIPLLSAKLVEPDTIAFVKFMVWKTRRNFEANRKITLACTGPWGRTYLVKGEFREWVTQGPLLEQFEAEPIFRYNAYMGANMLGIITVKDAIEYPGSGVLGPLGRRLVGRNGAAAGAGPMPREVVEKWGRKLAVKFLGFMDQAGDPLAVPEQGLHAVSSSELAFPLPRSTKSPVHRLSSGAPIAASVLAFDPVAYQVKGTYRGTATVNGKPHGMIEVAEVYSASPPTPGKRLVPRETGPAGEEA